MTESTGTDGRVRRRPEMNSLRWMRNTQADRLVNQIVGSVAVARQRQGIDAEARKNGLQLLVEVMQAGVVLLRGVDGHQSPPKAIYERPMPYNPKGYILRWEIRNILK